MIGKAVGFTVWVSILAQLTAMPARAAGSYVYTSREKAAGERVRFKACYHREGFEKDRCEPVGDPQGYSPQALRHAAEMVHARRHSLDERIDPPWWRIVGAGGGLATLATGSLIAYKDRHVVGQLGERAFFTSLFSGMAGLAGAGVSMIPAGVVSNSVRQTSDREVMLHTRLRDGYRSQDTAFEVYRNELRDALSLASEPSVGAGPSLSDAIFKELDEPEFSADESAPGPIRAGEAR